MLMTAGTTLLLGRVLPVCSPPIDRGAVILVDGTIAYVGSLARAPHVAADATEVEVNGGTIIPGLIDAHVHLVACAGADFAAEVAGKTREHLAQNAQANAQRALRNGIVAVRDLGAPQNVAIDSACNVRERPDEGPDITSAGRAITSPGGHIAQLGVEARGTAAMAAAAHEELRRGADGIKLVATGGVLTSGTSVGESAYEEDELAAAAAIALAEHKWVAVHAIGYEGTKRAIRAGATTVEHGVFLDNDAVQLMAARGTVLVSTRIAIVAILKNRNLIEASAVAKVEQIYDKNIESLRRAARAGIPIAAASDAGTPFNAHGRVAEEAALLVRDIGLSNESALQSVTTVAARCLLRADLGHLSPGASGHLVVLEGDPLDDVQALNRVKAVVYNGRTVNRHVSKGGR